MKRRMFSLVLALLIIMSTLPTTVYATSATLDMTLYEIELMRSNTKKRLEKLETEINSLNAYIHETIICSEANRAFNTLHSKYLEYLFEDYTFALHTSLYKVKYWENRPGEVPEFLKREVSIQERNKQKIILIHAEAKVRADEMFVAEYADMCRLANAEAGGCDATEQCLVVNVAENRKRSSNYPNTLKEVIFQPGQYSCVTDGNFYKQPTPDVCKNIEEYMRGHVDTGMPNNVVKQAGFKQGKVWLLTEYGHYYCYE